MMINLHNRVNAVTCITFIALINVPTANRMGLRSYAALPIDLHGYVIRFSYDHLISGNRDVFTTNAVLRPGERVRVVESTTGKTADIWLNSKALTIIDMIKATHPLSVYLFQSIRSRNLAGRIKPFSRQSVSKAFSSVGAHLHLT